MSVYLNWNSPLNVFSLRLTPEIMGMYSWDGIYVSSYVVLDEIG